MKEIQVAIVKENGGVRVFYIAEDDPTIALRALRKHYPGLPASPDTSLYPPLNEAAGQALGMKPGDIVEWRIGETMNVTEWIKGERRS